jgi:iron complex outermembrane receptor protein
LFADKKQIDIMRKALQLKWNFKTSKQISSLLSLFSFLIFTQTIFAQDVIQISGVVTSQDKHEPLPGVAISIKGTVTGTTTTNDGYFTLRTKQKLPFTLLFTSVGFAPHEVEVNALGSQLQVALATQTVLGNEVVVTASRVPENILKSPVAIEKLDIRSIRESPAPSFY